MEALHNEMPVVGSTAPAMLLHGEAQGSQIVYWYPEVHAAGLSG